MNVHGKHELKQLQSLPLEYKIELTKQRIEVWYNSWTKFEIFNEATGKTRFTTIDTRDFLAKPKMKPSEYVVSEESGQVYVSFSGGKDSTVLKHIVDSMYPNVPAVFVNTGLEYPEIQKFVRDIKSGKYDCFNSDVEILRPEMRFDEVLKTYGYPLISKEISEKIYYAQKGTEYGKKAMRGESAAVNNGATVDGMYYLNIPLVQFPNLTQQYLKNMLYRVKEDNPDLLYTRMPNTSFLSYDYEGDLYGMGVAGGYSCVYSMEVSNERADEMMETVNAAVNTIKEKLAQVHGIAVGQSLSVAQKVTVAKVIHDYICTFAHGQYEEEGQDAANYWASILYSAFDPQLKSRCSGYTQAFNYVARMYGIESIYMSGVAYVDTNEDGDYADYGESGGHAWVAIRLSDEPYGTYPNDSHKWSCIDVYWDEPTHEAVVSGVTPSRDDVIWDYFLNIDNIFPKVGSERYQRAHRSITTTSGYGMYPTALLSGMDAQPKLHMPYNGETNEFGGNT